MSLVDQIASALGERGDKPNVALAQKLADESDKKGVQEIAENLWNPDKKIQSDCLKVLYEIGYRKPELVVDYVSDFLKLLQSKDNRLIWGAMIGLSTIAHLKSDILLENWDSIRTAIEKGSVITVDAGMKMLSRIASARPTYPETIFSYLLEKLSACRPKSVAMYAEFVAVAVRPEDKAQFFAVLEKRKVDLNPAQLKRIERVKRNSE